MNENTLLPTHSCFDDSIELIDHIVREDKEKIPGTVLVHAICVMPNGREYAHAWVEHNDTVIFSGIYNDQKAYFQAHVEEFYSTYNVKETTKYTVKQALEENLRNHSYGPWDSKYVALCGNQCITMGAGQLNALPVGVLPERK